MSDLTIYKAVGLKRNGKEVVRAIFDDIAPAIVDGEYSDIIFKTQDDDQIGLIKIEDDDTFEQLTPQFSSVGEFKNGISIVSHDCPRFREKFGLVRIDLSILCDTLYDKITRLENGFFEVEDDGFHGLLDSEGDEIIPCIFKSVTFNSNTQKFELDM